LVVAGTMLVFAAALYDTEEGVLMVTGEGAGRMVTYC